MMEDKSSWNREVYLHGRVKNWAWTEGRLAFFIRTASGEERGVLVVVLVWVMLFLMLLSAVYRGGV